MYSPAVLASIPSPPESVWWIGPIPIRAYALCIIAGVIVAIWLGERRWAARGGTGGVVTDVAVWAIPFGLVGARLYHVITDYQLYFGPGPGKPIDALKIWNGGLGIWGAVALGALGAWIACRRRGISLAAFADAVAPGLVLAQAIGRWGNWFNQELYGRPSDLPWALEIDLAHRLPEYLNVATYHPTFLYESLWNIGVAVLVIWADRRFQLGHGRAFALYVAAYTLGRAWIEYLRIDPAHHFLGLRINDWTSGVVFLGAVAYLWFTRHRGREESVELAAADAEEDGELDGQPDADGSEGAEDASRDESDTVEGAGESEPAGDEERAGTGARDSETGRRGSSGDELTS